MMTPSHGVMEASVLEGTSSVDETSLADFLDAACAVQPVQPTAEALESEPPPTKPFITNRALPREMSVNTTGARQASPQHFWKRSSSSSSGVEGGGSPDSLQRRILRPGSTQRRVLRPGALARPPPRVAHAAPSSTPPPQPSPSPPSTR